MLIASVQPSLGSLLQPLFWQHRPSLKQPPGVPNHTTLNQQAETLWDNQVIASRNTFSGFNRTSWLSYRSWISSWMPVYTVLLLLHRSKRQGSPNRSIERRWHNKKSIIRRTKAFFSVIPPSRRAVEIGTHIVNTLETFLTLPSRTRSNRSSYAAWFDINLETDTVSLPLSRRQLCPRTG